MKNKVILLACSLLILISAGAQTNIDKLLPVRAFCISAPKPQGLDRFIKFIKEELAVLKINTLILRIDFNYQFKSHPELSDSIALSNQQVQQLVAVCGQNNIHLIPQINLLGHQSWAGKVNNLLKVYPQFDETPQVLMPLLYVWPNADSLYCKSYCPLHPDVHAIVYDLIDEICTAFEADSFHAGMDEVFDIGDAKCPRCSGKDKAVLFAGEVNNIRNHLAIKKRKLWIWGDRLIDGRTSGAGEWEGSFNNTQQAIDLIAKDITICDWHYEKLMQTPVYFTGKGFRVITCTWKMPAIAIKQTKQMISLRGLAKPKRKRLYAGMMQTIWSNSEVFLDEYYSSKAGADTTADTQTNCLNAIVSTVNKIAEVE